MKINKEELSKLTKTDLKKIYDLYAKHSGYSETPPTIMEFISDPYYLGQSFNGGENVFPYWKEVLKDIFPTPFYNTNKYKVIVLSGATGIGKCLSKNQELTFQMSEEDIKKYNLQDYVAEGAENDNHKEKTTN